MYRGFTSALQFVNSAIVARYVGKSLRLDFQLANTYVQGGMTFVGGFTNYYSFAVPKRPNDTVRTVQMGNLLMFATSLLLWTALIVWVSIPSWHRHLSSVWLWAILCMPLTILFGFGSRLLNAIDQISWLNRVNAAQPVIFLLIYIPLTFVRHWSLSTRLEWTYILWVTSYALTVVVTMAVTYRLLRRKGVTRWRWSALDWRGTIAYGGWSSIAQIVNYFNYRVDFWLVSWYFTKADASVYGIAVTAAEVLNTLTTAIASVAFARMTGNSRSDAILVTEVSTRQTLISSSIAALGMCVVFPVLIVIAYGRQYEGAILPFFILLPGLVFRASGNIVIQYATNALGRPQTSIWMNGISIVINAICCLLFFETTGILGGAIASTASYVLSFIVYVWWFGRATGVSPGGLWRIRHADWKPYMDVVRAVKRRLTGTA